MLFLSTSKPANTSYSRGTNVLSLIGVPPSDNAFCSRHCTRALVSRTDIPHTSLRTNRRSCFSVHAEVLEAFLIFSVTCYLLSWKKSPSAALSLRRSFRPMLDPPAQSGLL